ncbi:hypothetical protein NEOLEDRAFT_1142705 [Neolentinus lepideus HHB14362 ss-1]|uniref:DRBM domain-containing protein n=1 Tax=Neolentinus lepideus HHB14362 ss-1 TaxID=1314782 RepID=A0A165MZV1_9AGAM|nr:hypothetical protein NEOLEDRAFT_1142705 [Neolentinus lepideus HHB14362 ss-1]
MDRTDSRLRLNNYLVSRGALNALTWEVASTGPRHDPVWTAIAKLNGDVFGQGVGSSRKAAIENASQKTLSILANGNMEIGPAVGPSIVQEPQENRAHHSAIEGSAGQGLRRRGPRKPRPYRPSEEASVPFIVPPFDEEETFHHTTRSVPVPESAVPLQGEAADLPQSPDGSETSYSTPREETELDVVHSYPPPTYRNPNSSSPSLSSVTPPSPPTDPSSLRRATHRLRIFLAPTHIYKSDMEIRDEWDDADVLEHLNMVYRDMRSAVRRWLSAKKLR